MARAKSNTATAGLGAGRCMVALLLLLVGQANSQQHAGEQDGGYVQTEAELKQVREWHFLQPPYTQDSFPDIRHWNWGGSTEIEEKRISLTQGKSFQRGYIWNSRPAHMDSWEVTFEVEVTGDSVQGDDGMAFWFVKSRSAGGPLFGGDEKFVGLAVIFDSKDDDNQNNNPSVAAFINDGTHAFDYATDGWYLQTGGCIADYRNRDNNIGVKVSYHLQTRSLEVFLDLKNTGNFQKCLTAPDIDLPMDNYFGFTASTSDRGDSHFVHHFDVKDLHPEHYGDSPPEPTNVHSGRNAVAATPVQNAEGTAAPPTEQERPRETSLDTQKLQEQLEQMRKELNERIDATNDLDVHPGHHMPTFQEAIPHKESNTDLDVLHHEVTEVKLKVLKSRDEVLAELRKISAIGGGQPDGQGGMTSTQYENLVQRMPSMTEIRHSVQESVEEARRDLSAQAASLTQLAASVKALADKTQAAIQRSEQEMRIVRDDLKRIQQLQSTSGGDDSVSASYSKNIMRSVSTLQTNLESLQSRISSDMRREIGTQLEELNTTIKSQSSFGFWAVFVFLQFVFGFGFLLFRRRNDGWKLS